MRAVKDSLAVPLRAKWEKSEGSRLGYWHVQGNRLRSSRRVGRVGKLRAVGDRAGQPAMRSTGSWQKGVEDTVLRYMQRRIIWRFPILVREGKFGAGWLEVPDPLAMFTIDQAAAVHNPGEVVL